MEKKTNRTEEKVLLTQVFQALDRRVAKRNIDWETFRVKICGRLIELRFEKREMRDPAMRSLLGQIVQEEGEPDAVFLYWRDDCSNILPAENFSPNAVWQAQDDTGFFWMSDKSLYGGDVVRRRFYFARPEMNAVDYAIYGPTLVTLFSRWASASDLMLLHAAAVGSGGKGVLVVGRGGRGKSTFSATCLVDGMDFVSDDYTLLSASGPLWAMPIYTTVSVNPDMYVHLPELGKPAVPADAEWCNGKLQFAVAAERLSQSLEIRGIVIPSIGADGAEPMIRRSSTGTAMVQLLHSSAVQVGRGRDTALIRQMAQRLSGLPVYEMQMSRDLRKNPAALRRFIEKEL